MSLFDRKPRDRKHWNYTGPSEVCEWWSTGEPTCTEPPMWNVAGGGLCRHHELCFYEMWKAEINYYQKNERMTDESKRGL